MKLTKDHKQSPLISVIVPCHNNQDFILETLQSVLAQTYRPLELVIVDDGSTDNSRTVVDQWIATVKEEPTQFSVRFIQQANEGAPKARNKGLMISRGAYVKFLDADDILFPEALSTQLKHYEQCRESNVVFFGDVKYIDQSSKALNEHFKLRKKNDQEDSISYILAINPLTSCVLHKREYLERIGGFDTTLPKGQEYDLHLRIALSDVRFEYHPDFVYAFRIHNTAHRISNQKISKHGPYTFYDIFSKQEKLILEKFGSLKKSIALLLGQRYWAYGRAILREGYQEESRVYFSRALALGGKHAVMGSRLYLSLSRLLNPVLAEKIIGKLKSTVR